MSFESGGVASIQRVPARTFRQCLEHTIVCISNSNCKDYNICVDSFSSKPFDFGSLVFSAIIFTISEKREKLLPIRCCLKGTEHIDTIVNGLEYACFPAMLLEQIRIFKVAPGKRVLTDFQNFGTSMVKCNKAKTINLRTQGGAKHYHLALKRADAKSHRTRVIRDHHNIQTLRSFLSDRHDTEVLDTVIVEIM